jgi:hypothetical protein
MQNPAMMRMKWFLFQDDDIYLRYQSLRAMLQIISTKTNHPLAIVSAKYPRGLYFSSSWNRTTEKSCSRHMFPIAQPAFLNTAAVQALSSLIESNGLMHLRRIWRGTHDHLLGLSLWLYNISVRSFHHSYYTNEISSAESLDPLVVSRTIAYHRMRNWNLSQTTRAGKVIKKTVVGQVELDNYLATNQRHAAAMRNQTVEVYLVDIGERAYKHLIEVDTSSPYNHSDNALILLLKNIRSQYFNFTIAHC